jgi:Hemerythrin HHE cation binding domain
MRQQSRTSPQRNGGEHGSPGGSSYPASDSDGQFTSRQRVANPTAGLDSRENSWESVQQTPFEDISLGFVPLGRDWAMDVVGLPHNAARRELRGLYYCLASIERGDEAVLADARRWFAYLAEFIECVFAMEEGIVFPWLAHGGATLPESMSSTRRAVKCGRTRAICQRVDSALEAGVNVRATVDRLANVVLSHFATVESVVPQLMRSVFDASEKEHVVEVMAASLAKSKPEMFLLLARGFNDDLLQGKFLRVYGRERSWSAFMSRITEFEKNRIDTVYNIVQNT